MHIVPTRKVGKKIRFLLGRVRHAVNEPEKVEVKIVKKEERKLIVGRNGVYVLDDALCKEVILRAWEDYLDRRYRNSKRRGSRAKGSVVEHPVDISEDFLRDFLREKGICFCNGTGYIDLETGAEPPKDADELIERLFKIASKGKHFDKSFSREEIYGGKEETPVP